MRLKSLKLRGAIGLKAFGDEINIDFERFDSGPLAIVGPNGAGKTTILENLHPWPTLISRDGSLANHFYLKDSAKEFEFEYDGHIYLCKHPIDGEHKKIEAYLYQDGKTLNDGKVNSYKALVDKLFGSPKVFFKSIFLSQGGERISQLSPAESKDFFVKLLGFDLYQIYEEKSKTFIANLQNSYSNNSGQVEKLNDIIESNKQKIQQRGGVESEINSLQNNIKEKEVSLEKSRTDLKILENRAIERRQMQIKITALMAEVSDLKVESENLIDKQGLALSDIAKQINNSNDEIQRLQKYLGNADIIRQKVKRLEALSAESIDLEKLKSQIHELEPLKSTLQFKIKAHKQNLAHQISELNKSIDDSENLSANLSIVPCKDTFEFVSTCPLITTAREASNRIESLKEERNMLQEESNQPIPEEVELEKIDGQIKAVNYDREHHQKILAELEELRQRSWTQYLSELDKAEATIDERRRQIESLKDQRHKTESDYLDRIADVEQKLKSKKEEAKELHTQLGEDLKPRIDLLSNQISSSENELSMLKTNLGNAQGRLDGLKQLEIDNTKLAEQLEKLQDDQKTLTSDISDWKLLESAFGKNGLQALELDAACPQISSIATEILQEFGREWSILISTVRASADKKKDIETFQIIVSTPDGIRNFNDLSGGEKVWIEASLRNAVMIYLIKNSGRDYRTIMQDEADGALDPERARAYLDTAFKAHRLTGAYHTIIISQRPDIWGQISQRIMLDPEAGKIETVVE